MGDILLNLLIIWIRCNFYILEFKNDENGNVDVVL